MKEPKRYFLGEKGLEEGEQLGRLGVYLAADYDKQSARIEKLEELLLAAKEHLVEYINADYPPYKLTYSFNRARFELDMAIVYEIDAAMGSKGDE